MKRLFCFMTFFMLLSALCWAQYFTGDGGRGKSIAILPPRASGLTAEQQYIPDLVQGEFVSNFNTYSAIRVLDRVTLERQYAEPLSSYYNGNAGADLGQLIPTDYLMVGNITKTAAGFALQMQITRNADKTTAASYSQTVTSDDLDNLTGIRRASLELLQGLGVTLIQQARTELTRAATASRVNAQTALARGIAAQRQGTEVTALIYYFQAAAFDPLAEAVNRSSILAANISSGNIGMDARNDIAWRNAWVARLRETEQYFDNLNRTDSMPFTLFYSDEIKQGAVNNQTVTLSVETNLHGNSTWIVPAERTLQVVWDGLHATGRKDTWDLGGWPKDVHVTNLNAFANRSKNFYVAFELLNSQNKVIGRQTLREGGSWGAIDMGTGIPIVAVSRDVSDTVNFTNVNANDITDSLTIRVATVNGTNAETAARNGDLQIRSINRNEFDSNARLRIAKGAIYVLSSSNAPRSLSGNLVIPDTVWGETVTSIGSSAFYSNRLTSVTIPNSVTSIGDNAFYSNQLTSVTIPNSVTSIGANAFSLNRLTSVTIPNSVTGIGALAFANNLLASVIIPNSVTSIGDSAFYSNQLTSVTISNGVTGIGALAFSSNQLTGVTIPNSVTSIGGDAFLNNRLTSVTIGADVTIQVSADGFADFYNRNGKKAGVYVYNGRIWSYRAR
jgi:TolB-like protein